MKWTDVRAEQSPRTLRQFAGLWILFFGGLAAWHGIAHDETRLASGLLTAGLTIGTIGLVRPATIRPVFTGAMMMAFPIGWVMSRVIVVALFASIVPVALLFRLTKRDPLHLRRSNTDTYWAPKPMPQTLQSYLRQS